MRTMEPFYQPPPLEAATTPHPQGFARILLEVPARVAFRYFENLGFNGFRVLGPGDLGLKLCGFGLSLGLL